MKRDNKKETTELFKKKIGELEEQLKRVLADYQNLQKRIDGERREWIKTANKELLLRLLPVLDTLMLAANHSQDEGVKLSVQQFLNVLKPEGVERIKIEGLEFDPKMMECVETGEGEDNEVLKEIRSGFTLWGQVIRPAQVKVGKKVVEKKEEELAKQELQKGDYM